MIVIKNNITKDSSKFNDLFKNRFIDDIKNNINKQLYESLCIQLELELNDIRKDHARTPVCFTLFIDIDILNIKIPNQLKLNLY